MGFLRKALFVYTGGASGLVVKANSKTERAAKAAEKQVRLQRQMLQEQRHATALAASHTAPAPVGDVSSAGKYKFECPACTALLVARAGTGIFCPKCQAWLNVAPQDSRTAIATIAPPPQSSSPASLTNELERLADLHSSGALSAGEFDAAKRKLLG
jgi:hypothetical protein